VNVRSAIGNMLGFSLCGPINALRMFHAWSRHRPFYDKLDSDRALPDFFRVRKGILAHLTAHEDEMAAKGVM
jgi:hypothetical protein